MPDTDDDTCWSGIARSIELMSLLDLEFGVVVFLREEIVDQVARLRAFEHFIALFAGDSSLISEFPAQWFSQRSSTEDTWIVG